MPRRAKKTVGNSFVHLAGTFLLIASLTGCAGLQPHPAVAPPTPGASAQLLEADKALAAARGQVAAFYADLDSVAARSKLLRGRPCWSGFERILLEYPTLTDPGAETDIPPVITLRLSRWSRESHTPWEPVMRDYSQLVERCAILEMKRVAARQKLISVQAAYMAVVMMDAASGRQKEAKKVFSMVNSLDKPGAELDSIRLNRLGLYGAAPHRTAP